MCWETAFMYGDVMHEETVCMERLNSQVCTPGVQECS